MPPILTGALAGARAGIKKAKAGITGAQVAARGIVAPTGSPLAPAGAPPAAAPVPAGGGFDPSQDLIKGQAEFDRRVAAGEFDAPTAPAILGEGGQGISQGTEPIRDDQRLVKAEATDALADLDAVQGLAQTDLQGRLADLDRLVEESRTLTDIDLEDIEKAATTAGAAFDPLIAAAEESKRQGLARAVVGAGERGGFESTQFAGQAALTQIEGGTFVGAGGELSKIKGQLEQNIQRLRVAKEQAISAARAAASQAKRTGKREDAALAADMLDKAQQVFEAEQNAITKRIDVIAKLQDIRQAQISFSQDVQDDALANIENISAVGGEIPDELRTQIEDVMGVGFVDLFAEASKAAAEATDEASALDAQQKVINMLAKTPTDREVTLEGVTYSGFKSVDTKKGLFVTTETDRNGNVTQITTRFNPDTQEMEVVGILDFGQIGKGFKRGGGGDTTTPSGPSETFEEFVDRKQNETQQTFNLSDPSVEADLRAEFEAEQAAQAKAVTSTKKFSGTQEFKLEQAGLLGAPRAEQLDFLFGEDGGGLDFDDL